MDPQTPAPNQFPTPPVQPQLTNYPSGGAGPSPEVPGPRKRFRWPLSRKITIIVGVVVLVVGLLLVAIAINGSKDKQADTNGLSLAPGSVNGPYVEREGYPRKEIGSAIADAMALKYDKNTSPVKTSKGVVVLPACSVISQDDIRKAGLRTAANPTAGSTERSYIDGQGSGLIPFGAYSVPSFDEANYCRYSLEDSNGSVTIEVLQPFMVSEYAITDEITRNYDAAPAIAGVSGVQLFQRKPGDNKSSANVSEYYIRKDANVSLKLRVDLKDNRQSKTEALIKTAAASIARLAASPEGVPKATYDSPTYKQKYLRACYFLADEDMQILAGVPAAAMVEERIANSTGVIQYKNYQDETLYTYVQNGCSREGVGKGVGVSESGGLANNSPHMDITTTSYDKAKAAEYALRFDAKQSKTTLTIPGVGDEAIIIANSVGENVMFIRKDRFVVELKYNTLNQRSGGLNDQNKMADALLPYAKNVVKKMEQ
jgi:hypothetical protein